MSHRPSLIVLAVALLLCACSGPSETAEQSGPSVDSDPNQSEKRTDVAQYETFDASKYKARPPEEDVDVDHQVPKQLLRARIEGTVKRTLQGFRIQVFSALDQQAAQDFRAKVRQWWENNKGEAPEFALGETPPINVVYSQPYYRVRIGAFARRSRANRALKFVRRTFESAFIAQSTVTVTR
jgi:phosphoserine aminotransferase